MALPQEADVDETVLVRLGRLPWAADILRSIAARPATVSTVLAADLGMPAQGPGAHREPGGRVPPVARGEAILGLLDGT